MEEQTQDQPRWAVSFFAIWTAQALSLMGSRLAQFALVWWLTETTGSATVLATATLVALLPQVLLGPFIGTLVDRWPRRLVMIVADSFVALVGMWLVYLFWADAMQIWHVYVVMAARALGGAFHWPAMQSSTTLMVPKSQLSRVAGLNQTLQGALNIVAPPLGAFLMSVLALHTIMGIDVVTALLAIVPLFFITIPQPEREESASEAVAVSFWQDFQSGFRYVWQWKGLLYVCLLAMLLNFFVSPPLRLLPLLVKDYFSGDALQLGWMNSAWGVGIVTGGMLLAVWGGFKRRIITGLVGIVGTGLGVAIIGLTPVHLFPMALAAMFFSGILNAMCNGALMAVLQEVTAPEVQGRVFNLVSSLTGGMMPIALLITRPLADSIGVRPLFVMGGLGQVLLGAGAFLVPTIMQIEENHQAAQAEEEVVLETAPA